MCRNGPARPLIFIALDCDHTRLSPSQPNSYLLPAAVNARKLILNAIERGVIKWFYTLFRSSRSIYPASFCSVRLFAIIQLLLSCFSKKRTIIRLSFVLSRSPKQRDYCTDLSVYDTVIRFIEFLFN